MKFILLSRTILGIIVAALPILLPQLGISFSEEDGKFITDAADSIVTSAGLVVAAIGRFMAKEPLTLDPRGSKL